MSKIVKTKMLVILIPLVISACGGSGSSAAQSNSVSQPPATILEAIKLANKNVAIPVLNRDFSVAGPDINLNGVRDDIDSYIDSLADSPPQ